MKSGLLQPVEAILLTPSWGGVRLNAIQIHFVNFTHPISTVMDWLKSEGESIQSLCTRFYRWVLTWKPEKFAANGTNDINLFLTRFGLTTPVVDVNLPNWRDRQHLEEHHEAAAAKRQEIPMPNGLCCPYMQAHYPTIKVAAENSERRNAKISHVSHCALYDAYEVTLYALNRNLPQL